MATISTSAPDSGAGFNVPAVGAETASGVNMEAERSIKDIIDERQE